MRSDASSSTKAYLHRTVQDLFSLKNHTIVITGGARGLGLAFGFAVAESGGNVAVLDASDKIDPDFALLVERHPEQEFRTYKVDVTKPDDVGTIIDSVVKDFGRIDGLITAAGVCVDQPFLDRAADSVARSFNINVLGTYYVAQAVARQMRRQNEASSDGPRGGSIIFIGSMVAYTTSAHQNMSDYISSKGAVITLAKCLGVELAPYGIRVNSISPGHTKTPMVEALFEQSPKLAHSMTNNPPMRRMADLVDLKGVIAYLLSDASAYQTGEDTIISGGMHFGRSSGDAASTSNGR